MAKKNGVSAVREFVNSSTSDDWDYVAKRADITREYLLYHIGTGRRVPTEETAAKIEEATLNVHKRKPHVKPIRCFDLIEHYQRCPHEAAE